MSLSNPNNPLSRLQGTAADQTSNPFDVKIRRPGLKGNRVNCQSIELKRFDFEKHFGQPDERRKEKKTKKQTRKERTMINHQKLLQINKE